jgi:hypothetical protein
MSTHCYGDWVRPLRPAEDTAPAVLTLADVSPYVRQLEAQLAVANTLVEDYRLSAKALNRKLVATTAVVEAARTLRRLEDAHETRNGRSERSLRAVERAAHALDTALDALVPR